MKPWIRTYRGASDFRDNGKLMTEIRFGLLGLQFGLILNSHPGFALWRNSDYKCLLSWRWFPGTSHAPA